MIVSLLPAYGRDYRSKKAVMDDWKAGKDFVIACAFHPSDGKPANQESFSAGDTVNIRYNKQRFVCVVHVR